METIEYKVPEEIDEEKIKKDIKKIIENSKEEYIHINFFRTSERKRIKYEPQLFLDQEESKLAEIVKKVSAKINFSFSSRYP